MLEVSWRTLVAEHHDIIREAGLVGVTLALLEEGELTAVDYSGHADLGADRPVDSNTIYHWASVTKTLTAVAVMQLVERGLLGLDGRITEYLPELRRVHNPFGSTDEITIRHLLSHTAGFRDPTWPWGGDQPWHPHEPGEWTQIVAMLPYTRVHFEPGSAYGYSNLGTLFLGRILEIVTNDHYETHLEKNILRPLGLQSSYFDWTPWHLLEHRSNNYRIVEGRPVPNGLDFDTGITVSNGGLNAPVADIARWLGFLMGSPGSAAPLHNSILSREILESMWEPVIGSGDSPLGPEAVGLSFFLYEIDGHRLVGHTGFQKSFRAFILFDPEARIGAIGAANTAEGDETAPDTDRIMDRLRLRISSELFPLLREMKGLAPRVRV